MAPDCRDGYQADVRIERPRLGRRSGGALMKRQIAITIALLGLSGCAQYRWTHPSFTEANWRRDIYECERDMRQSAYFGGGIVGQINANDFQERCLQARGYSKVKVDKADLAAEEKLFSWA